MKIKEKSYLSKKWKALGLLFIFAAVLVFVVSDAFLYQDTVAKVISVKNTFSYDSEGPNEEVEKYYDQKLEARILNGKRKGQVIALSNTYSYSGVNDERYRKGDQLFVSVGTNSEKGVIIGKKRDVYLTMLLGIFLILLLLLNKWKGGLIFISLVINISIFLFIFFEYKKYSDKGADRYLIIVAFVLMLVFSVFTLLFAGGFHKKTVAAIISTLVTTLSCYGIYEVMLHTCERLPYEMMEYSVKTDYFNLPDIFLIGVLMGSLGAVMDVSISIAAGVAEIIKQTPDIRIRALVRSVREMGYDIMGTMINVLFFTYISGTIPILIIKIKNGYTLYHLIHFQLIFEIIRFLMGAIGIVLAIPVAGLFSVLFLYIGTGRDWRKAK